MINETERRKILQIDLYLHSFLQEFFCETKPTSIKKKYGNCQNFLKYKFEIPPNTIINHLRLCRVRYITTLPTTRVRSTNPPMLPITMTSEFVFHRDAENRFPCEIRVSLRIYNSSRLLNRQINERN